MKKKFHEEIEDLVDKRIKNPPKPSDEFITIVDTCLNELGGPHKALAMNLIATANLMNHLANLCDKYKDDESFSKITGDPVIKMILPFVWDILSCKRFK